MTMDDQQVKRRMPHFLEDFEVGDVYRSAIGRTVTETDNVWFTCLTMNTNQSHFNRQAAADTRFGEPLVNSTFTLALVTGLSVADTSQHAVANLGWENVSIPGPVFVGDTIYTETEVLAIRASKSRPETGIVRIRSRGLNQDGETVLEFVRSFMMPRREGGAQGPPFPAPTSDWAAR